MSSPSDDPGSPSVSVFEQSAAWRDLHVLLATGLRHPDEQFRAALETGEFEAELRSLVSELDVGLAISVVPPVERSDGLTTAYIDLFEGGQQPYAPPVESPYRPWYDRDEGGLMNGPSAAEMRQRYRALDVSVPDAYSPDHIALLLEYGSLLLEADEREAYRSFVRTHFEWVPALRRATDTAAANAPVYRWLAVLIDELCVALRDRLDVPDPTAEDVDRMVARAGNS
ncbi:TorD/DmsD family molecular chaperone [Halapricum desulfuricans]|uniref:TorD/DmsD family molecular chaperone n=1 Tax=Halapricum desulfuricans TaxID=2841257 RepID=UPI001E2D6629|nr:molecular chaperone TorD family protein [Halapricum desulfuricans]